ncbi:hypothetical protein OH76DRAFT_1482592 [Lentinus brumalis]|uniref:BTB domain-containing protein n=1 Tax=Lentinus brumalis TaxID=2498619 RepID=A0A371DC58_9APHY|nr:hypothetical protein OH76DRAFT_1482592 [Polyporus brumalis]
MDYSGFPFYPSPDPSSSGTTSPEDIVNAMRGQGDGSDLSQTAIPASPLLDPPDDATVSITFGPSLRDDDRLPDSIIVSSNHVYFYIHRHRIINASSNGFDGLFYDVEHIYGGSLPTILCREVGDTLNIVLHIIYGMSSLHYFPALQTVDNAFTAMIKYGIPIEPHAAPYQQLYQLLLSNAPYHPIETFALAASHGLEDIAVIASGHLLSFDMSRLTDELVTKIGPVYLKRLILLHQDRMTALRHILLQAPRTHSPMPGCRDSQQGLLIREWALATAQLAWDATPSISANSLRLHLENIGEKIACEGCRRMLVERIHGVCYAWSLVKQTI